MNKKQEAFDKAHNKVCAYCGKQMYRLSWNDYVYILKDCNHKYEDIYFCSWTCFNKGKQKVKNKKVYNKYRNM